MTIRDDRREHGDRIVEFLLTDRAKLLLTATQHRRLSAYMLGASTLSIAREEGVKREVVSVAIQRALAKIKGQYEVVRQTETGD